MKAKSLFDDDFDRLIGSIYKVLLTRGMEGVVIYATDVEAHQFLANLVPGSASSKPGSGLEMPRHGLPEVG